MTAHYLIAAAVLAAVLTVLAAPYLMAAHQWWFRGGKLLNDRLGPKPPTRRRRL